MKPKRNGSRLWEELDYKRKKKKHKKSKEIKITSFSDFLLCYLKNTFCTASKFGGKLF